MEKFPVLQGAECTQLSRAQRTDPAAAWSLYVSEPHCSPSWRQQPTRWVQSREDPRTPSCSGNWRAWWSSPSLTPGHYVAVLGKPPAHSMARW